MENLRASQMRHLFCWRNVIFRLKIPPHSMTAHELWQCECESIKNRHTYLLFTEQSKRYFSSVPIVNDKLLWNYSDKTGYGWMGKSVNVHQPLECGLNELKACCKLNYVIRAVHPRYTRKKVHCVTHTFLIWLRFKIGSYTCLYDVAQSKFVLYVLQFVFGVVKRRLQLNNAAIFFLHPVSRRATAEK